MPNRALRPPHRRKHHPGKIDALSLDDPTAVLETYSSYDLPDIMAEIEELESCLNYGPDEERRKKFIRILVKAILLYNVIPKEIALESLTHNTTYATKLVVPDNALDKEALRVRVSAKVLPPSISINFFSKVVRPNIGAKNGIIHVVNHPVLPPPSIFQELFLAPRIFGAVVSHLYKFISPKFLYFLDRHLVFSGLIWQMLSSGVMFLENRMTIKSGKWKVPVLRHSLRPPTSLSKSFHGSWSCSCFPHSVRRF